MSGLPALPPPRRTLIAQLLAKASSSHDAEAVPALRKVDAILRESGLTWHDVLAGPPAPASRPAPRRACAPRRVNDAQRDFSDMPSWCDACAQILAGDCATAWERKFCTELLRGWQGPLTRKQLDCLEGIYRARAGFDRRARA
jgi:hypothetical protein